MSKSTFDSVSKRFSDSPAAPSGPDRGSRLLKQPPDTSIMILQELHKINSRLDDMEAGDRRESRKNTAILVATILGVLAAIASVVIALIG